MALNKKNSFIFCLLFLIFSDSIYSQSISLYPKWGKKIKIYDTYDIKNGSIIIKDSSLIKKVIPLKSLRKVKYSQKSYKSYGDILLVSGKWILNCSLFPAVIGYPNLFYSYGSISTSPSLLKLLFTTGFETVVISLFCKPKDCIDPILKLNFDFLIDFF